MSKNRLTLDMLKGMMENGNDIFVNESVFKAGPIGKAMKRKLMDHNAIAYLYENCENWFIREYCLMKSEMTYKEAAISGMTDAVHNECEWGEFFSGVKGFFDSAEDLLSFTKETYGIDLAAEAMTIDHSIDHKKFLNFAEGILRSDGRRYLLS